ncbi:MULTISPECIES: hypothetical protein [unclassified Caulobacter]|uniref:hypothetical protein n=1 Tax=unclassified Caulobacter TaxID=2648921 RepID=UPI001E5078B9|nr:MULTISPECIES: hypothetical protein [unclassified Caulobacter]
MIHRLVLCVLSVAALATASAVRAEDWKPAPGEAKTFYDADFLRMDTKSGLVVLRIAEGKPNGPYRGWPASKGPIMIFALDCAANRWMDLGMDFTGDKGLGRNWRNEEKIEDISGAVGGAGKLACETRDSLPKVDLP